MNRFEQYGQRKAKAANKMHYGRAAVCFSIFYSLFAASAVLLQLLGMGGGIVIGVLADHPYLEQFIDNSTGFLLILLFELMINLPFGAVIGLLFAFVHNQLLSKVFGLNLIGEIKC
ncbi:hypothetical protein [uncultured Ruegeria sp.]|uniref:hypothetical protein n=1 Tax=uncultured Ruegeria sp. TaxID=259304 RepID=UPI00260863E6|nr:hypothetical protein [uncultured Ruegeria sp.]